ncbi:MRN complex-interacting protein isoform X2 [Amia ocellicauda]|uniref:MRN complex-interacting protein isoform X2 n=1 Tax=Amia ocellicauda TaxID=2972642 RepID=UPI00346436ED
MVQEFQVLRCFSCKTFQVQQVKKSKKWNCKMCGEKQTLMKLFGQGSGAHCRRHVQKLNSLRGHIMQAAEESAWVQESVTEDAHSQDTILHSVDQQNKEAGKEASRWSKYLQKSPEELTEETELDNEDVYTDRDCLYASRAASKVNSRKRKRGRVTSASPPDESADPVGYEFEGNWKKAKEVENGETLLTNRNSRTLGSSLIPTAAPNTSQAFPAAKASSHSRFGAQNPGLKASKWDKFLSVSSKEEEEPEGTGFQQQNGKQNINTQDEVPDSLYVFNSIVQDQEPSFANKVCKTASVPGKPGSLRKRTETAIRNISSLAFCKGIHGCDELESTADGAEVKSEASGSPVCQQPRPSFACPNIHIKTPAPKMPQPSLFSLFQIDEDFDDTF